jgi:hypothetical protein
MQPTNGAKRPKKGRGWCGRDGGESAYASQLSERGERLVATNSALRNFNRAHFGSFPDAQERSFDNALPIIRFPLLSQRRIVIVTV